MDSTLSHSQHQSLQTAVTMAVTLSGRRKLATQILQYLHWLLILDRITLKILMVIWRSLHCFAPGYISYLVKPYIPVFSLRLAKENLLVVRYSRQRLSEIEVSYTHYQDYRTDRLWLHTEHRLIFRPVFLLELLVCNVFIILSYFNMICSAKNI